MNNKIKVLIVDDSRIFRSALEQSLSESDDIQIIGSVFSGTKALEFIRNHRPNIVTLDVEMPGMDGLSTLRAIQEINASTPAFHPIGVIMLSAFTKRGADITIKALEQGAFDFIPKPQTDDPMVGIAAIRSQLVLKIRLYTGRKITPTINPVETSITNSSPKPLPCKISSHIKAILIGGSTGGPKALNEILPSLSEKVDIPIFIVQHMPATFTESMAKSLDQKCRHTVKEAKDGEIVMQGHIYIAPGGKHMLLRKFDKHICLVLSDSPPEEGCRPSVNVLFRSAAAAYGRDVIAVILTGMGTDGAGGVIPLKRAGAHIIVQDEETSVVWGMPKSALDTGCVDEVLPISQIQKSIISIIEKNRVTLR